MGIREYIESNEKTHKKGKNIKYIFCEGKTSNQLIVNFPGFAKAHELPQYNYIRTLKNCNCNRLFILDDYGPRGSYLIGESGDSSIEEGVISLINDICDKYRIKREEVITNGTSKGGFCALYYGIKYNFGYVIAGSPQTKLGDYLCFFPEIADYISGGHESKDISYLNSLLYNLVEDGDEFPEIYIHVGEGDHHYKNHIIPFFNELDKKNVTYHLELRNYFTHSLIGNYYIEYLLKTLKSIDKSIVDPKTPEIISTSIQSSGNHLEVFCGANGDDLEYSVELYSLNDLIEKTSYQNSPKFMYPISTPGKYHAKIYVKDDTSYNTSLTDEIEIKIEENLRGIENADKSRSSNFLGKKFNSLKSKIGSGHLNFFNSKKSADELNPLHELKIEKVSSNSYKFTIQRNQDVESFAWYILLNGERVDTIWYRQENYLEYTFKEPGNYQIKYFVKDENSKLMYLSEPILLDKQDIK
jgi:hypothetical protein